MKHKILFVDDEVHILNAFRVSLRKVYAVSIAVGPKEGLAVLADEGPFAVVVSDLKMPEMDGIQFLAAVQHRAPETIRIMLTGYADLDAAIAAVNTGQIFRFLTKPCPPETMQQTLAAATRQYALEQAEKELLRGTVRGSIKILTDVLALLKPEVFGRCERSKRLAIALGEELQVKNLLQLEMAAMLSQLGCVTLDDALLEKVARGDILSEAEQSAYDAHPEVAASLLMNIPRMGRVAEIIRQQNAPPADTPEMLLEARLLKVCLDYDALTQHGMDKAQAVEAMRLKSGCYDASLLDALLASDSTKKDPFVRREVALEALAVGMILDEALRDSDGTHIMPKGTELTEAASMRLHNFMQSKSLPPSLLTLVPREMAERMAGEMGYAGPPSSNPTRLRTR